jgi:hypothetical protein
MNTVGKVTDDDVEAVESEIGMGSGAWDCVDPKKIISAARGEQYRMMRGIGESLETVDRFMKGVCQYEAGWINYPEKPEKSPASIVHEIVQKLKP